LFESTKQGTSGDGGGVMAFDKGGFIITTNQRHIGKAGVTLGNLTEIARILLGKNQGESVFPAGERIETIVAFGGIDPKDRIP
jgi:hypothetical protein